VVVKLSTARKVSRRIMMDWEAIKALINRAYEARDGGGKRVSSRRLVVSDISPLAPALQIENGPDVAVRAVGIYLSMAMHRAALLT
jgi:hypothetical protein